ncbi:odorant receptor 4-like [Andrena cerasifolii]|uniref:odorant receptor 4-like n=1 Tax=Andrena cerasifolii TaxID=2819439 RepID=UPI004037A368
MTNESAVIQATLGDASDYSLQLSRWCLKPIGAWPATYATTRLQRVASFVVNVLCYCTISFTLIPCILYVTLEDADIQLKLRALGPLSHWFVGGLNYTTLLLRSKEIRQCMEHIQADWRTITRAKDQSAMLLNAKFGRYVAAFCAGFMQGGLSLYCVVTWFSTEIVYVGNRTRTVHILPCAVYKKLLNVDASPMNEIVFLLQCLSGLIVNSSAVAIFSLAAVFTAHACGQLDVLMTWVTEYVNETGRENKDSYSGEIRVVVEHHLRVLSFISRIEAVMQRICFLELFRSTFNICMLGYYILTEWPDHNYQSITAYFMVLMSTSFNIFIVCYIGEVLTEQCHKIGEVVYMTDWYQLPYKNARDLIMVIARSSVVTKITAGKMIHMSVYTFGSVIKTAFAYLNLLRETT